MQSALTTARMILSTLLALAFVPQLNAGVVAISRSSTIQLQGQAKTDVLDQTKSTDQFGLFNDSVSGSGGDVNGDHANISISQNTTIDKSTPNRITGSGNLAADAFAQFSPEDLTGPLFVHGTSNVTVLLQIINNNETLHATGDFSTTGFRGTTAFFSVQETSAPPPGLQPLFVSFGNEHDLSFDNNLNLHPGSYKIVAETGAGSSGSGPSDPHSFGESYSMNFAFSVGQGATAIPLPPAVWTAIPALLAAGVATLKPRRRARYEFRPLQERPIKFDLVRDPHPRRRGERR